MLHLISLGSSFAAGPGIEPSVSIAARRSANNYPSILAKLLSCDKHTDLSYSGATLLNIIDTPQDAALPQIEAIPVIDPKDEVIVTITAGGNDIGYVGRIGLDSLNSSWMSWMIGTCIERRSISKPESMEEDQLVNRFQQTVRAVRKRIPQARIVLVGYLTLLGDHVVSHVNVPLSTQQILESQERAELLRRAYLRAATSEKGCEFCDIATLSKSHGVGAPEPWVTGYVSASPWLFRQATSGPVSWHPNRRGMEAVAVLLRDFLAR